MTAAKRHTIYDIAEEAGVSIATVSRVLRGENTVTDKTRKRVEDVIMRLNYQPSAIARGLTQRHSRTFGIILPKLDNPHYARFFKAAYDEAAKAGYAMLLFPLEAMKDAKQNLSDVLAERRLDGVVMYTEYIGEEDRREQLDLIEAIRQYMPVVMIGSSTQVRNLPSVTIDLSECVRMLVRYLAEQGHERIALLGGFREKETACTRDAGYREALKEARLPYISDYRVFGKCTTEDGEAGMNELLDKLIPSQWPTAVIAANDLVALGAIHALEVRGKRVPEDMTVVGCDNLFFDVYIRPSLTSVNTRQDYIGRRAVQMLLDETQRGTETVPCELIVRESSAVRRLEEGDKHDAYRTGQTQSELSEL